MFIGLSLGEIRDHRIQIEGLFRNGRVLNQDLSEILTSYHSILKGFETRILEEADQTGKRERVKQPAQPAS